MKRSSIEKADPQQHDYKRNETEVQVQGGQDGYLHCFPYFYTFTWKCEEIFSYTEINIQNLHLWWEIKQEKTQPKKKAPKPPTLNTPTTRPCNSLHRNPNNLPFDVNIL